MDGTTDEGQTIDGDGSETIDEDGKERSRCFRLGIFFHAVKSHQYTARGSTLRMCIPSIGMLICNHRKAALWQKF